MNIRSCCVNLVPLQITSGLYSKCGLSASVPWIPIDSCHIRRIILLSSFLRFLISGSGLLSLMTRVTRRMWTISNCPTNLDGGSWKMSHWCMLMLDGRNAPSGVWSKLTSKPSKVTVEGSVEATSTNQILSERLLAHTKGFRGESKKCYCTQCLSQHLLSAQ